MTDPQRKKILACIFATAKECGVDNIVVRESIAHAVIGKGLSSADVPELKKVREHMQGLKPETKQTPPSRRPKVGGFVKRFESLDGRDGMASPAQLRLIHVSWMKSPAIRQKTDQALRRFLFRQFKISDLRFVAIDQVGPILKSIRSIR